MVCLVSFLGARSTGSVPGSGFTADVVAPKLGVSRMNKRSLVLIVSMSGWLLPIGNAQAIPLFYAKFEEKYGASATPEHLAVIRAAKCTICHIKDAKSKKEKNEYGAALQEAGLDKKDFPGLRAKAMPDVVQKEIFAILDKVAEEKGPSGKTYGEDIKASKLPGSK
ncbi:MAG TPA: hypothetical protein VL096_15070 [Pirellulaceae bacterium]|nr:hypothetical protein [Pirellulaceae bacterium]